MTTLKDYILHQLREAKREMLKAIEGLSEEDLTSHEPGGQGEAPNRGQRDLETSPIAWIVCHCLWNVEFFIHRGITGQTCLEHEKRFTTWPLIDPRPGDPYPPLDELIERWTTLLDASAAALESLAAEQVQENGKSADPPEPLAESCLRVINHTNAHLRQIWCILGRRRVHGKYPTQETWLA